MTSEEVSAWLEPLFAGAEHKPGIDLWALMKQATKPVEQVADTDVFDRLSGWPDVPDDEIRLVVDWVQFGQLLRAALGWDNTYPERPARKQVNHE